jgi:hypothetical protein
MDTVTEVVIKVLIEAILISGILGFYFSKREERMKKTLEEEFRKRDMFYDTQFGFKLKSLEELLAPVKLQLIRSKIAITGYTANNDYREKIIKECNETIRKILLDKGHLIPADLMPFTVRFISHFDEWLQAYRDQREMQNDNKQSHVFVYSFPHDAEKAFNDKYDEYRKELAIETVLT